MLTEGSRYNPVLGAWSYLISVVQVPQQLCHSNNRSCSSGATANNKAMSGHAAKRREVNAMFMQHGLDGRTSYLITGGKPSLASCSMSNICGCPSAMQQCKMHISTRQRAMTTTGCTEQPAALRDRVPNKKDVRCS